MRLAPRLHPAGIFRAAEISEILRFAPPAGLAGRFTGLAATLLRAILLMMPIAIIRLKELTTTTALTPSGFGTHDELPPLREENGKSNPNAFALDEERRRKKSFTANASKKKHPKNIHFQTGEIRPVSFRR
jgi:hypothetical protein